MPVHMHYWIIGENISKCRKEQSLTQEQLAERSGICQQFLSRLERGAGVPSVETIMALCDALDIESNVLLTRASATHKDDLPCRLRSDGDTVWGADSLIVIRLEDLPPVDLELPDTPFDENKD